MTHISIQYLICFPVPSRMVFPNGFPEALPDGLPDGSPKGFPKDFPEGFDGAARRGQGAPR